MLTDHIKIFIMPQICIIINHSIIPVGLSKYFWQANKGVLQKNKFKCTPSTPLRHRPTANNALVENILFKSGSTSLY